MLDRHIEDEVWAHLEIMPVVLITGARQTGKTTLVKSIGKKKDFFYVTFDDENALFSAQRDPSGWILSLPKPVIIDEVQRFPEIFLCIKKDVDENRLPGRYLLTGSANPLLLPRLDDSLAGRMAIIKMFPFSQGEIHHKKELFISNIFADEFTTYKYSKITTTALHKILLKGGFPSVQTFHDHKNVKRWINSYIQAMIQRDVKDIANIEGLKEFPKLFRLLATRSSNLLNISDISRSLGMVNVTLNRYLRLLETLYFVCILPPWFSNLGKRFTKAPKLHFYDTSIMASLLDADEKRLENNPMLTGQLLETFIFSEILKLKSWSEIPFQIYHFRDRNYEVDFVLEKGDGTIVGIEVKSSTTIKTNDLKGLLYLKKQAKHFFKRGIVLHPGKQIEPLGHDFFAVRIQSFWE